MVHIGQSFQIAQQKSSDQTIRLFQPPGQTLQILPIPPPQNMRQCQITGAWNLFPDLFKIMKKKIAFYKNALTAMGTHRRKLLKSSDQTVHGRCYSRCPVCCLLTQGLLVYYLFLRRRPSICFSIFYRSSVTESILQDDLSLISLHGIPAQLVQGPHRQKDLPFQLYLTPGHHHAGIACLNHLFSDIFNTQGRLLRRFCRASCNLNLCQGLSGSCHFNLCLRLSIP